VTLAAAATAFQVAMSFWMKAAKEEWSRPSKAGQADWFDYLIGDIGPVSVPVEKWTKEEPFRLGGWGVTKFESSNY